MGVAVLVASIRTCRCFFNVNESLAFYLPSCVALIVVSLAPGVIILVQSAYLFAILICRFEMIVEVRDVCNSKYHVFCFFSCLWDPSNDGFFSSFVIQAASLEDASHLVWSLTELPCWSNRHTFALIPIMGSRRSVGLLCKDRRIHGLAGAGFVRFELEGMAGSSVSGQNKLTIIYFHGFVCA